MNAIELFHSDGKSAGVFYCEKCRIVARTKELAEQCCRPNICACGKECEKYWTKCKECIDRERDAKEQAQFEAAKKIQAKDYNGFLSRDGFGSDGYASIDDMLDDPDCPEWAWATKEVRFAYGSVDDITSPISERSYPDFEVSDLHGIPELEAAIEKFNEANKDQICYQEDRTRVVILK
jgi:hypothetical protein